MSSWTNPFTLRRGPEGKAAGDDGALDHCEAEIPARPPLDTLFPDGIKVLHNCANALVDICFVHGLTGDRERTWTADGQTEPWPKALLPSRLQQARILTFGYDAYVVRGSVASSNRLGDHASSLLNKLTSNRESCDATSRPLVFVVHSLGGLVCKKATLLSQNSAEDHLHDIFDSVRGIVFLGTPHKGAWLAKWASIPASALGFVKSINTKLLDVLQSKNEILESIQEDFLTMTRRLRENDKSRLQITCFFEELPMRLAGQIVSKESASFEGYTAISIHANHRDMVKFATAEDDGFVMVLGELKRWVKQIDNTFKAKEEYNFTAEDLACLNDLKVTDPRRDKERIEQLKGGILRDSYRWVLSNEDFVEWRDRDSGQLLWIRGDPGKGKTMLLCGIIDELNESCSDPTTVAYFFCQGAEMTINNATAVLRSLIYMLVIQHKSLITHVRREYDQNRTAFEGMNAWQALANVFREILNDPLILYQKTYVIIDALDECTTDLTPLVDLVAGQSSENAHVKWLVSSRNWREIEERLNSATGKVNLVLELNEYSISAAVEHFIHQRVDELTRLKGYGDKLRETVLQYLLDNSQSTFLWVALVCQQLAGLRVRTWHTEDLLKRFPRELKPLYNRMFERIVTSEDSELCKRILSVVLGVYTPITIEVLRVLVNFDHQGCDDGKSVREMIDECGSFLKVDGDFIFLVHQSAKDFLLDPSNETFEVNKEKEHHKIFSHSLHAFKSFERDMYKLKNPGTSITDVTRPSPDPLAGIWYSCLFWVDHLEDCQFIADALEEFEEGKSLDSFLRDDFLHWIEAISLLESTTKAIASMLKLENLVREHAGPDTVLLRVHDACRVIRYYRAVIETHPLQIYASLIFTPTQSITRNSHYVKPAWILEEPKISADWDSCLLTLEWHDTRVQSIAWSRNGMLASVSWNCIIIWDPATGQRISSSENGATLIAFSQDDVLASNDTRSNLHIWDISNCLCELRIKDQTGFGYILCISWLRDGRLAFLSKDLIARIGDYITGQWRSSKLNRQDESASCAACSDDGKIAIAFEDYAIRVWDLATDSWIMASILKGHIQEVTAAAWSPHGRLASGSQDLTLRIWDPATLQCVLTLKGHNDEVSAVAWSHDERLASGSADRTIRIWNSVNGQCISVLDGHYEIISLAFSQDGRLASGSSDGLIKIWDTASACASLNTARIESGFKPGGRAGTLKVCELSTGQTAVSKSHSSNVDSIAWSPNGMQLASASTEITIWDLNAEQSTILYGHREVVYSMSWSPDGNHLASGSEDERIIVWDLSSGQKTVLECHSALVIYLAWSPLGDLLASKSACNTTQIWSMATGQRIVIWENETWEAPIIWSTDGRRLASWSLEGTLIIWDSTTGRRQCKLNIKTDVMSWIDINSWNLRKQIAVFDAWYKIPPAYMRFFADMGSSALSIGYSIEMFGDWIFLEGQRLLWLPPEYRPVTSDSVILGDMTRLAFGCSAGRIWTITLSANGLVGESLTREIDSDTSGARTE